MTRGFLLMFLIGRRRSSIATGSRWRRWGYDDEEVIQHRRQSSQELYQRKIFIMDFVGQCFNQEMEIRRVAARSLILYTRRTPRKLRDVAIYRVFVEAGLGSLKAVAEEFELVDWLYRCTAGRKNPCPSKDKVRFPSWPPLIELQLHRRGHGRLSSHWT